MDLLNRVENVKIKLNMKVKCVTIIEKINNGWVDYTNIINYDVLRSTHKRRLNYEVYNSIRF